MAAIVKSALRPRLKGTTLTPELRSLIDNCVVPALVREYLANMQREKQIASAGETVAECAAKDKASAGRVH